MKVKSIEVLLFVIVKITCEETPVSEATSQQQCLLSVHHDAANMSDECNPRSSCRLKETVLLPAGTFSKGGAIE